MEYMRMDHPSTHNSSSLRELKRAVEEMRDPEDREINECMLIVIAALQVGANVKRLVELTGYNRDCIRSISLRMRKAALWVEEAVDDREWWDHRSQPLLGIFSHALVAQGTLNRVPNANGGWIYFDAETGEVSGEWNPPPTTAG
jgi:hypothetical protein